MLILIELLRERVGSAISYSSIAEDLHVSPHTVKHWIDILENMYLVFKVAPYSKISRGPSLKSLRYISMIREW